MTEIAVLGSESGMEAGTKGVFQHAGVFCELLRHDGVPRDSQKKVAINTTFEGWSEVLTPVTILVVLVAGEEMHREGFGGTDQGDRGLAHSLPANLPHISRLCPTAHPGWL
jgi:hypothetical protein